MLKRLLLPVSLVVVVFWSNPVRGEEHPAGANPADAPTHTLELNDDEGSTELVHFFRRHYRRFYYYPRYYGYYRHHYYRPYYYYPRYYYRPYYGYSYYYSYPAYSYYSFGYYGCADDATVAVPTIPLVDECLPAPDLPQPTAPQADPKGAAPVVPGPAPKEQPQPKAGQGGAARPRVPADGHLVSTEATQPQPAFGGSGFAAPAPRQTPRTTGFASDR